MGLPYTIFKLIIHYPLPRGEKNERNKGSGGINAWTAKGRAQRAPTGGYGSEGLSLMICTFT